MSLKTRARHMIAARHGKPIARRLAGVAEKFLNAYNNVGNWDVALNGELRALRLVIEKVDGDVFDVGANDGDWTRTALPHIKRGRLFTFEPVPQVFEALKANVGAHDALTLVNAGLGSTHGPIQLNYVPRATTISSAYPLVFGQDESTPVECRITTGDRFMAENGIDSLAYLKIDVEGMEAETLAGFEQAFADRRIKAVQIEHGPSHIYSGHTLKYFYDWLTARDFDLFVIFPRMLRHLRYELGEDSFDGKNLLAVRRDVRREIGL